MPQGKSDNSLDAVEVINPEGAGEVVLLCEHASNHIPARYDGLGLDAAARASHAAWDPGARDVALQLSRALDAPLVAGRVSRLVYDCNRPPEAESAMPGTSELIEVPGNRTLTPEQRAERVGTVYRPFCAAVTDTIAARRDRGQRSVLITVHSFTPVYFGQRRETEVGILHDADSRLADAMLSEAHRLPHRRIARNDPYGPDDGVTHSLKLYGIAGGLLNVMIELRNDLLTDAAGTGMLAQELLTLIGPALASRAAQDGEASDA
ncbi:N-formylglutamate amidohydrolase [Antarcticimicrobium luteum]|uniref:N-formylglutamate amidohydrolase n=1 Tax=Antarcticimicrobium luteum TaxID=2547397 RepID=A0A4R5UQZ7_9RHOB|nr:N-formylglutamate amidohydrolase [Antarcticimicrobium luteum]TDK41341.1 N-formylglutamate amidohydrolase [Antarcticimicrobium luteum]